MKSLFQFLILFGLGLHLVACVELKDPDKNQSPAPEPAPVHSETLPDLRVDKVMYLFNGQIISEEERKYLIYQKKFQAEAPATVTLKYHKVLFTEQGVLYTLGQNLNLSADEIESRQGHLLTFPEGITAPENQSGRSGGNIYLETKKADGQIFIELRGENGGKGTNAPAISRTERCVEPQAAVLGGHGGVGGNSGMLMIKVLEGSDFAVTVKKFPGTGGQSGWSRPATRCYASVRIVSEEIAPTPSGQSGEVSPVCLKLSQNKDMSCD